VIKNVAAFRKPDQICAIFLHSLLNAILFLNYHLSDVEILFSDVLTIYRE